MPGQILNGHNPAVHDRLTDAANQHVAAALRTCALGERVTWDTGLQLVAGPQGHPQAALAIYLQIPSPLIGQCLLELLVIEAPQATQATITQAVTEAAARLFAARAQVAVLPTTN